MTIDIDAIRQRGADRADIPALLAEIDRLRGEREHMELNPTGTVDWLKNRVAELADQLHKANAQIHSLEKATTAYANEVAELRKQVCLIIACQECGEKYEYDGGVVHFSNLDEAQSMAEDDDWRRVGDLFFCGGCIHEPHTFTPDGLDSLTCQRCDLEEDDHEQAAEKAEVAR